MVNLKTDCNQKQLSLFLTPPPTAMQNMTAAFEFSVIIAEVTQPSLGVGYELGRAVQFQKKTLCLFRPASGRRK